LGANLGGLIQTGEALAASFAANLGNLAGAFQAGINGAIQAGENLAANLFASLPGLPALTFPNLGALGVELSAALNGLGASFGGSLSAALNGFGAALNAALSGSLNLGANLGGLIQTGETLAANFAAGFGNVAGNIAAGINGAIQTGANLAANFFASLPALTLPNLMLSINAALGASLGGALNGLAQTGATLVAGLGGSLSGLLQAGEALGGSLAASLSGLTGTGNALAMIWENTAAQIGSALSGGLSATVGVGFPGLIGVGASLATGFAGATAALEQTGGTLVTSLSLALRDLALSLQAALNASLGIGVST
jgi:hypothetical protein